MLLLHPSLHFPSASIVKIHSTVEHYGLKEPKKPTGSAQIRTEVSLCDRKASLVADHSAPVDQLIARPTVIPMPRTC